MTNMLDISAWQHPYGAAIDWQKVKAAGIDAVMVKATEGIDYVNPYLRGDVADARAAGLTVGAYHYSHPAASTVEYQVEYALKAIEGLLLPLGLADDLEVTEGQSWVLMGHWVRGFHQYVGATGRFSPVYLNRYFLANISGGIGDIRLWLASPGVHPTREVWAWQSGSGPIDGIVGEVDYDTCYSV